MSILLRMGFPVVIHDETVDRTSDGNGFVKDYTLNAIKKLNMGSWKSSQYSAEKILTLEEFLDWIAPTSLLINIELKNNIFSYKGMEKSVLNMVEEQELLNRTVFSSFNHESLYKLHLRTSMQKQHFYSLNQSWFHRGITAENLAQKVSIPIFGMSVPN